MPNPRLASRYAKALIDLAIEKGQLEEVAADAQWLKAVCKESRDFLNLLRSPIIKGDSKRKIVDVITAGKVGEITQRFIQLLISKSRESVLPEVIQAFEQQYNEYKGIHTAVLTTAVKVSDAVKKAIVEKVKKEAGVENIKLEERVNPSLIGGFTLEMGDKMIDSSIAYDLRAMAKQFKNNDFIYNVR